MVLFLRLDRPPDTDKVTAGITWGFTIAICCLSYFGKFFGCTVAARIAGFSWREASTIGSLMSCKGSVVLFSAVSPNLMVCLVS